MHFLCDPLPEAEHRERLARRIGILGIGNRFRGDDSAGILVAEKLAHIQAEQVVVRSLREPCDLLEAFEGLERAIVIDACLCDRPAGEVLVFDWPDPALAGWMPTGTSHTLSLAEALAMAGQLGIAPEIKVFAISGKQFALGQEPSPDIETAVDRVAQTVEDEALSWIRS